MANARRRWSGALGAAVALFVLAAACGGSGGGEAASPLPSKSRNHRIGRRQAGRIRRGANRFNPAPAAAPTAPNGGVTIPKSAFQPNTWGYVGCSNTHDTIWGYEQLSVSSHLFWPFDGYEIEGTTVAMWADPNDPRWAKFDREMREFDAGSSPPVVWFQMCESLDPSTRSFHSTTFGDVKAALDNLKQHAGGAIVFISPLQSYDPPTLCPWMGANGVAVADLTDLANQAVDQGLAQPGPGVGGNPNLGPLTESLIYTKDDCHPSGGPHGPGPGAEFLGQQLHEFFDTMK